jgi:hypothetical protein
VNYKGKHRFPGCGLEALAVLAVLVVIVAGVSTLA